MVEVLSPTSWTHDLVWKRDLYRRKRIPVTWIVDHEERCVHVVRPKLEDVEERERLVWHPDGVDGPLLIDLVDLFRQSVC